MTAPRAGVRVAVSFAAATALLVAPTGAAWAVSSPEVTVQMVEVGHPGNGPDPATSFGAVADSFRIAKYDVTIGQYIDFLNAVARKADKHGLYNSMMADDLTVAGIRQTSRNGRFSYEAIQPQGKVQTPAATASERPITYVSWFDAARFANWMANGQPRGRQNNMTTENGAYNLTQEVARDGMAVPVNAINPRTGMRPTYSLPTENQWYKAAYYSPTLNGGTGGYFPYATQSTTPPGNSLDDTPRQANYTWAGIITITGAMALDLSRNFLTDVGAFTGSAGPFGTYDMNGNLWEWNDANGAASPIRIVRGGGWTSYFTYLQSTYSLGQAPTSQSSNAGFRLASSVPPGSSPWYDLVTVGHPGNVPDRTGFGTVDDTYWIGTYEVTIGQYAEFLNAVAKSDPYGLYDANMSGMLNSAGITRTGTDGAYAYAPMDNDGDSSQRPMAYVSWFDVARFANWMSNGRPTGAQGPTTTEDGAYPLNGATRGAAVARNTTNPHTGLPPTFTIPTENQWYKAAYYAPETGTYYLYATKSDTGPGNQIGPKANQVNYINDYDRSNRYSVTQKPAIDAAQNYLTDVGYFRQSPSYYGAFDLNGNVYDWNDLDGTVNAVRGQRGGFWFSGPPSIQSYTFNTAGATREANDAGIRLISPAD